MNLTDWILIYILVFIGVPFVLIVKRLVPYLFDETMKPYVKDKIDLRNDKKTLRKSMNQPNIHGGRQT